MMNQWKKWVLFVTGDDLVSQLARVTKKKIIGLHKPTKERLFYGPPMKSKLLKLSKYQNKTISPN